MQAGGGAKSGTETGRGIEGAAALQEEATVERLRERDTEIWMSKMHHDGAVESSFHASSKRHDGAISNPLVRLLPAHARYVRSAESRCESVSLPSKHSPLFLATTSVFVWS